MGAASMVIASAGHTVSQSLHAIQRSQKKGNGVAHAAPGNDVTVAFFLPGIAP
jgi:hypothetical protein